MRCAGGAAILTIQRFDGTNVMPERFTGFAMRFTGADGDINLATEHPEFDAWKWVSPEQLPELVVSFMRRLYLDVVGEFRPLWSGDAGS